MTIGGTTLTSAGLGDWFLVKLLADRRGSLAKRFGGTRR